MDHGVLILARTNTEGYVAISNTNSPHAHTGDTYASVSAIPDRFIVITDSGVVSNGATEHVLPSSRAAAIELFATPILGRLSYRITEHSIITATDVRPTLKERCIML